MPLFNTATISRFAAEGESDFNDEFPSILHRVALASTVGQSLFVLPSDVKSVRRVTWKGFKLDPLPHRNFREVFQSATQQGKPFWYVYNNVGQNIIQLFPAANEVLTSTSTDLYSSTDIGTKCIIEYFRNTDSASYTVPAFFRRRLLKSYVLRACFNIEGKGQNAKASAYFKNKYKMLKSLYGELLGDLYNKPRKLVISGINASSFHPGHPVLPIDRFGVGVNPGE